MKRTIVYFAVVAVAALVVDLAIYSLISAIAQENARQSPALPSLPLVAKSSSSAMLNAQSPPRVPSGTPLASSIKPSPETAKQVLPASSTSVSAIKPGTFTVELNNKTMTPAHLTVPQGSTVTFVNKGTRAAWPASDPHPLHDMYPVKGGCVGSVFDACHALTPGESWKFVFSEKGVWGYHDDIRPMIKGTIEVR